MAQCSRYFSLTTKIPLTYDVCGQLISKDGFLHHRRTFDWDVLILVTEGILYITANGTAYEVTPNQYILLKAGEEHFGHQASRGKLTYLWVHLRGDKPFLLQPSLSATNLPAPSAISADQLAQKEIRSDFTYFFPQQGELASTKRVSLLFHQLMDLSLEKYMPTSTMLDYTASLLLMELTFEYKRSLQHPSPKLPSVIIAVSEWIRANYYQPFTVAQLAEHFGYQADYLSSLFKKHMGISLIEYTNRLRIESSKTLLSNYDLSIKEAAFSCGFPDEKYYMKVFKKYEGITPTQYKQSF